MQTIIPILDGEICGLPCGERPSGVTVARVAGGRNAQLLFTGDWRFAPVLFSLALTRGLKTTSDGRLVIMHDRPDPAADLAAVEAVLERGGVGGIRPGVYGSGVYTVSRTAGAWSYTVVCKPSGRASLKGIGEWTGKDNTFTVCFSDDAALASLLERAETAKMKGATTTITLPTVPGVPARVDGGEILIGWPGSDTDAGILKAVPSLRWDKERKAYTVSTRYAKRTIKALEELLGRREAVRQALAERLPGLALRHLTVTVSQERLTAWYVPACERAYRWLASVGKVQHRSLTVPLNAGTDVDALIGALVAAETALDDHAVQVAEDRRARETQAEARSKAAARRTVVLPAGQAPAVGAAFRLPNGTPAVAVAVSKGKYLNENDELVTACYPSELWGRTVVTVTWEDATAVAAVELERREAAAAERKALLQAAQELRQKIAAYGSSEELGHVPAGEVLWEHTQHQILGLASWVILADDGRLWSVDYDGSDGGAWGGYNCGTNTRGRVWEPGAGDVDLLRRAAAAAGFTPYSREQQG